MPSLFGTLSIAAGALAAEQGAMDATTNNVSNTNTPGYPEMKIIRSCGEMLRRSFARSRPLCPGRTTSVTSKRTTVSYSLNIDVASNEFRAVKTR